jgi:hypothetical protein
MGQGDRYTVPYNQGNVKRRACQSADESGTACFRVRSGWQDESSERLQRICPYFCSAASNDIRVISS